MPERTPQQWALHYGALGWPVFPMRARSKAPSVTDPLGRASADPEAIRRMWIIVSTEGIGVNLAAAGLVAVCPDSQEWVDAFERRGLPRTAVAESRPGHRMYFFRRPADWPLVRIVVPGEYDIFSAGQCTLPPSVHPDTGKARVWLVAPEDVGELPVAPAWVLEMLAEAAARRVDIPTGPAAPTAEAGAEPPVALSPGGMSLWTGERAVVKPDGMVDRSATLYAIACELARAGTTARWIAAALRDRDEALGYAKYSRRPDAAHAGPCPTCDRLQRAHDRMRDRARRYLRRLQTVENLARHPFHQGRTAVVLALAREVAEAPDEDRRPDGAVRARVWRVAKRAGCSEDTVSKAIKALEEAGVFACDRPKRGQGAQSRNETWPRLDLPAARTRDENAVLAYLTQRAPNARRTGKEGFTHGGPDPAGGARKPVCLRCGPAAEVSETVTRQWRCTCCDTLLESRTTEVDRYPNPAAPPYPQVAAIDPLVKTYPQVAAMGDAPADPDPDPAPAEDPIDFTLYLALPANGARVRTPDGPGILVGKHAASDRATVRLDACPHAPPFDYRLDEVTAEDIAPEPLRQAVGDD